MFSGIADNEEVNQRHHVSELIAVLIQLLKPANEPHLDLDHTSVAIYSQCLRSFTSDVKLHTDRAKVNNKKVKFKSPSSFLAPPVSFCIAAHRRY